MQLPGDIKLTYFDAENKMQEVSVDDLTKGKKVRRSRLAVPAKPLRGACLLLPLAPRSHVYARVR